MTFRKLPGLWLAAACILLLSLMAFSLQAQTGTTGAINGTVTDATGGVVPNATVTATNTETGAVRTGATNAAGQYQFQLLQPGTYTVKFSASGFKTVEVPVTVNVTESPVVNRALEVGAQGQEITVEADVEAVQTASSAMGTVVNTNTATTLPLTTRNYTNLIGLSAGAAASVNNASGFGAGGVDTSVNGALSTQNNYMMDGVSLSSAEGGSVIPGFYSAIPVPNPDALEEFKIQTSLYDAGYGRNSGGNVNVVTKSGTNAFHGSAFEFFRNTDLNATDFFRNRQCGAAPTSPACSGGAKQIFNQNQFGGVFGGPIKKDKLFFFGSYQQTGQKNGSVAQGFSTGVTLAPIPGGNRGTTSIAGVNDANASAFQAALGAAFCPANHPNNTQFETNPGGAGAGTGTQVACDGSNINPYAMRYLQGTIAGGAYAIPGSGSSNYAAGQAYTNPALDHQYQGMLNIDYVINAKNTLTSRYFTSVEPQSINFAGTTAPPLPGLPDSTQYGYKNGILKLTTIVSNTVVNELRGSILRSTNAQTQQANSGMYATNIYPTCGTAAASQGECAVTGSGLLGGISKLPPQIAVQGQFLAYGGTNDVTHNQTTLGFGDQLSWTRGKHTFRFGGEWEDTRWTWVGSWLSHGIMAFQTFDDFLIGLPGSCGVASANCNGSNFSNVLNTSNYDVSSSPSGIVHGYRMKNGNLFVQDDWKVSQRLTINLGLRWEYDGLLSDKYGNAVNMWPSQIATVPEPITTQVPALGQPLFPAGGTYAGWVVPSNFSTSTYGQLSQWPGIISSGNLVSVKQGTPLDDFAPRVGFAWQPTGNNKLVVRGGLGYFYDRIDGNNIVHSIEQSPPYAPTLDQGASTNQFSSLASPFENYHFGQIPERWVNFSQANLASNAQVPFDMSSNITQTSMYEYMQTPLMYEWNLNVQYQFAARWVLELGYVGSHAIHQSENLQELNPAQLASPSNPIWGVVTENTVQNATLRVPYLGMSPLGMQYATTNGAAKYNSAQVTLRKQLSRGLTFQAAYTFSRAFNNFEVASGSNFNNPLNLQAQYGLNTQYRPQRLVVNYQYNFPGASLKGFAGAVLGGWALAGVTTIQNGQPLILTDSRGGSVYGLSGSPSGALSAAEILPGDTYSQLATSGPLGQRLGGATGGLGYFNTAALTTIPVIGATPGVAGTGGTGFGNIGIGSIFGPGQFNFDTTLSKSTRVGGIHENGMLQFRAEFFNLFNHPQFSNPATNYALGNFGQITSMSVNPRLMQLALKYVF
jgi:hypothetical protein